MTPRGVLYHVYGYYHMLISMVVSLSDKVFFFMLFLHSNHLVFTTLLLPLYNLHCEVYVYVCINWHCFTLCVCVCVFMFIYYCCYYYRSGQSLWMVRVKSTGCFLSVFYILLTFLVPGYRYKYIVYNIDGQGSIIQKKKFYHSLLI